MSVKLKYVGNGEYIMMVSNSDLTDFDIENLVASQERTVAHLANEQEVIDYLIGSGLYELANDFTCHECSKSFKSWDALNKHELRHIAKLTQSLEVEKGSDNG